MQEIGLGATGTWFRHIEPRTTREKLRAWRLSVDFEEFRKIGRKYDNAGIDKVAFTYDMKDDSTDEAMERPVSEGEGGRAATGRVIKKNAGRYGGPGGLMRVAHTALVILLASAPSRFCDWPAASPTEP